MADVPEPPTASADTSIEAWLGQSPSQPRGVIDPAAKKRRHMLQAYAFKLSKDRAEAEDLVHDAVARVMAGARSWDGTKPEKEKIIAMCSIIQSLLSNRRAAPASQYERVYAEPRSKREADDSPLAVDVLVSLEDEAAENAWVAEVRAQAARKEEGSLLVALIDFSQQGLDEVDDLCVRTGRSREDLKAARKTLRRLVEENMPKERLEPWRRRAPARPQPDGGDERDGES